MQMNKKAISPKFANRIANRIAPAAARELALLTGTLAFAMKFMSPAARKWTTSLSVLAAGLWFLPNFTRASFAGKSAVITGGSRGLGLSLAKHLLDQGASVVVLARDSEELSRASDLLKPHARDKAQVHSLVCDVTDKESLETALAKARACNGKIDLLINNAGSMVVGPFETLDDDDFESQANVHLKATVSATRAIRHYFHQNGGGMIINISSIGGLIPAPHLSAYCASKFALSGFSETVATELKNEGIHVLTVYPGFIRTGSPIQPVFKGNPDLENAWFSVTDVTPGLSTPVDRAAKQILNAAAEGRSQLVITAAAKFESLAYHLFPELSHLIISLLAKRLPTGHSHQRQTSA